MYGIKELKTRIKSISSTRKITRAMQLVSAAKMRKAQTAVLQSRAYAQSAWRMIQEVARQGAFRHPLIRVHQRAKKIAVVLLSSNKGLVGSLNANLIGQVRDVLNNATRPPLNLREGGQREAESLAEIITYGRKGQIVAARLRQNIAADFRKFDRTITVEDIYPIARFIGDAYGSGQYQKIVIIYNHFVSTIQQKPSVKQLLPFSDDLRHQLESPDDETAEFPAGHLFEPDPAVVVEQLIPRIVESQIYQAILESDASEHSARMVMMKNATEAAGDLIADLTLTFNQLRQNKITTELAEITAGKIALE